MCQTDKLLSTRLDGVALALEADPNGIAVNHPLDLGHDRIELGAGNGVPTVTAQNRTLSVVSRTP